MSKPSEQELPYTPSRAAMKKDLDYESDASFGERFSAYLPDLEDIDGASPRYRQHPCRAQG
ncbi:MAG TPA: hypothetical protein VKP30_00190 [Polyangiaceae bacterium]|nr:hypothetical protein [Polyangiaceae bacterium]